MQSKVTWRTAPHGVGEAMPANIHIKLPAESALRMNSLRRFGVATLVVNHLGKVCFAVHDGHELEVERLLEGTAFEGSCSTVRVSSFASLKRFMVHELSECRVST